MKKKNFQKIIYVTLLLLAFVLNSGFAFGWDSYNQGSGHQYDWRSGNSYNWNTDMSGNTHVRGHNYRTGSMWRTTIEPDGDMRGFDSDGNMWRYNEGTKTYQNFGTGETQRHGDPW